MNTDVPTEEPFQSIVRSKKQSAKQIRDKLDSIKNDDEITRELVNLLIDSMEYDEDVSEAMTGFKKVDYILAEVGELEASVDEFDI